jgi:hypothetical protein
MDEINAFITIPVTELTKIVTKCSEVVCCVTELINKYHVTPPTKEASKKEASSEPEEVEAATVEEASSGLVLHSRPNKSPIEMIIE